MLKDLEKLGREKPYGCISFCEYLYLYHSPVGYTSVPFALGGTGSVYVSNLELAF